MGDIDELASAVEERNATTHPPARSRRSCLRCGRRRLSFLRGYCRRCKREIRVAKQKRADDLVLLEAQQKRAAIERSAAGYERMGWMRIGDHFIDPMTVRAVEPYEEGGIFRKPVYGWNISFYHSRPMHIGFGTPSEAAAWLGFLGARAPHVQVIHRETQVFWWVSF